MALYDHGRVPKSNKKKNTCSFQFSKKNVKISLDIIIQPIRELEGEVRKTKLEARVQSSCVLIYFNVRDVFFSE